MLKRVWLPGSLAILVPLVLGCQPMSPIGAGLAAPPLKAAGWANGPAPTDLSGKVVVLEVFATW